MAGRCTKDKEKLKEAARMIVNGASYRDALLHAGYSLKTAKTGRSAVPAAMWDEIVSLGRRYAAIGAKLDAAEVSNTIKGRLYINAVAGKSDGNEACKLLGSHKDHQLFQSDSQTGVIVLQAPRLELMGKHLLTADEHELA